MRETSNRWEGNKSASGPTKSAASERGPNPSALAQADPDAALRQKGTDYETANNANLSGKPYLVKDFNGPTVVREVSNRW